MKLGIINKPVEDSFRLAKNKGLSFIELTINNDNEMALLEENLPHFHSYMKTYGVTIGAIGRWGTMRIDEKGAIVEEELQKSYRLIDICNELGCPVFNCGCNEREELTFLENCKSAINFFSSLLEYGKAKSVDIATVNCRWNNFVHSEPAWTVIHGQLGELGIKYDPSHSYYHNGDYMHEIKTWGYRFKHFHLKGALKIDGERYDDPPAGMGQLKWPEIMATLYAVGYDRGLSIEPHSKTWRNELAEKGIEFTINYIRPFL